MKISDELSNYMWKLARASFEDFQDRNTNIEDNEEAWHTMIASLYKQYT